MTFGSRGGLHYDCAKVWTSSVLPQTGICDVQEAGIVDAEGNRIRKDLQPDMREGQDRDLG